MVQPTGTPLQGWFEPRIFLVTQSLSGSTLSDKQPRIKVNRPWSASEGREDKRAHDGHNKHSVMVSTGGGCRFHSTD